MCIIALTNKVIYDDVVSHMHMLPVVIYITNGIIIDGGPFKQLK